MPRFSELTSCFRIYVETVNWHYLLVIVHTSFGCVRFNENVMNKPGFVDVYPASRIPRNLQHHFKSVFRFNTGSVEKQSKQMNTGKQKGLRIVTESGNLSSALRWISDEKVSLFFLQLQNISNIHRTKFCDLG